MHNFTITLFDKSIHSTKNFDCDSEVLNQFIRQYATQQQKKRVGRTFVAINEANEVIGFYTLSAGSVRHEEAPQSLIKGLPKYPIPTVTLGRLAIDKTQQRKGLGSFLLRDALLRVLDASMNLGIVAIVVQAKNEAAANFYKRYGFIAFEEKPLSLFIPMETVVGAVK